MKKILVVFLLLACFFVPCLSACSCSDLIATGLIYELSKDEKSYTVTGLSNYPSVSLNLKIPEKHKGKPVVAIGASAFEGKDEIVSVEIANSVTKIGGSAFSDCSNLKKVVLPNKLARVPSYAFEKCYDLEQITIPSSVTTIGPCAFKGCRRIGNLTIPNSVTYIGADAFEHNIQNFPYTNDNGVKYYGSSKNPYMVASRLTSSKKDVVINEKCVVINTDFAWENRATVETVSFPEGLQEIAHYSFYDCKKLTSISLPSTLTFIGRAAFYNCELLEEVVIPDGVEHIYQETFQKCTALKSIVFGSGLIEIYVSGFSFCPNIETVEFKQIENWYFNRSTYGPNDPEKNDLMIKINSSRLETIEKSTETFMMYLYYESQSNTTFKEYKFCTYVA